MADNRTVKDPVAEMATRALKKTNVIKVTGWDQAKQRFIFVAPHDCRIDDVQVVSDTGVSASDVNYYSFQVQDLSAGMALLSSPKTTRVTGGTAITADTPYSLAPNQNQVVSDGAVLELQMTETGAAVDLTGAEIIVVVEYT